MSLNKESVDHANTSEEKKNENIKLFSPPFTCNLSPKNV